MAKARLINILLVAVIALFTLLLCVKGAAGKPIYFQTEKSTVVGGPFESSNNTSRYALTESLAERGTVFFNTDEAKFASPDLVRHNGKFFSIFMPGISYIGVPFYLIGKYFGLQQLFTYFSVTLFGFLNLFLIARIASKLGANLYASLLAGFLFLFGTNALSYSLFYTQHITGVSFLLIALLAALGKRTLLKNVIFGVFAGGSILLDIPNLIFMLPIGIYLLSHYIKREKNESNIRLSFNMKFMTVLFGLIPFLVIFAWYNLQTTGSPLQLGQSLGQTNYFKTEVATPGKPLPEKKANAEESTAPTHALPFMPREQITGFYVLLTSDERSWIFYSPIVWLGALGFFHLYRRRRDIGVANTIVSVALLNILVYSMFADPWGGWAFGPRYLIPAAAMLCIGLGVAVHAYGKRIWFLIPFALATLYSIGINVLGALTTGAVPPKPEAEHLLSHIPYTYLYNIQLAQDGKISSLFYHLFFTNISGLTYIIFISAILSVTVGLLYQLAVAPKKKGSTHEG